MIHLIGVSNNSNLPGGWETAPPYGVRLVIRRTIFIVSNIILNELDQYIEHTLIPEYTRGQKRQSNPDYNQITNQRAKAKAVGDVETYRALAYQMRQTSSVKPDDDQFRRLYYCRYADDVRRS